ncbi:HEL310Cp [Eremothecium sinecaudum]|uniref:Dolichyl-phosphate-mannose--protein mannosyltransferase n=1 Tax=Eremothecium sinecaudum TaxID=45286 RepID=A0A109UZA5_9SACH|nr:HEL310Cp [Eremothecium sinecaudum]AMD20971.1 HEL310Cp [Eremothecium sinecaudum]
MAPKIPRKGSKEEPDDKTTKCSKARAEYRYLGEEWFLQEKPDSDAKYKYYGYVVTAIAFILRFWRIYYPREVIFDEVHFGKFASYYLERTYFFDVHPPFAKLLIAFVGWLMNYDGEFKFEDIGYSYDKTNAPFVAYRSLSAILGTLTVPVMFGTLREMNFKALTCMLGALLVALDNAHIIDSRLILLDATLIFTVALSIYTYVRFYKVQLRAPFSSEWYYWLYATGFSLSLVISSKYVGVFTFATIGSAVIVNLWQLLDVKAGLTMRQLTKHFVARLNGLIVFPCVVYLFWFYIHFAILSRSGTGDDFMSSAFQETLEDSPLAKESKSVYYYDIVTFKHRETLALLHSHSAHYPLRYEDGRVSSQGQQVTGYSHEDINNNWEIIPTKELPAREGQPVLYDDVIRLRHVATDTYLLAHDVASPYYPTNEEITTVPPDAANGDRRAQTLFKLQPKNKKDSGHIIKSRSSSFRIFHVDTAVALWTHNDQFLPDWGFGQQEVNGNKKVTDESNHWTIHTILNLSEERKTYTPKKVKSLPFFSKWSELQRLMFIHNNKLSADHPFASQPDSWPGSLSGVSFWTKDSEKKQIYFTGNIIGWWFQIVSLSLYLGIILGDLLTRKRSLFVFGRITRVKLYGPVMFLFIGWCFHYFPFFLMSRQKFLHHYLPAHLIAALFSAALWEVLLSDSRSIDQYKDESNSEVPHVKTPKVYEPALVIFFIIIATATAYFLYYFSPLVYAHRGLTPAEVNARQWFNIKLHFAK